MRKESLYKKWGLLWRSKDSKYLMWDDCKLLMFNTRVEVRNYANEKYGYIKTRKDLRVEPHCWRMPVPVKLVSIRYAA